jgi:hypothetical protein
MIERTSDSKASVRESAIRVLSFFQDISQRDDIVIAKLIELLDDAVKYACTPPRPRRQLVLDCSTECIAWQRCTKSCSACHRSRCSDRGNSDTRFRHCTRHPCACHLAPQVLGVECRTTSCSAETSAC